MKQKKKICKICGEERYLFSKGMCRYCWGKEKGSEMRNNSSQLMNKPLSRKSNTNIPLRTKSRLQQERTYKIVCDMIDKEAKENDNWKCFFCGEKFSVDTTPDHHHLAGRENDKLTKKSDIVLCHRVCHSQYHDKSVHSIPWYIDWLERIKDSRPELYEKELIKYNK